jgi:hypothetical protein
VKPGGRPRWIHDWHFDDETCAQCKRPLVFVGQISSGDLERHPPGSSSVSYVYMCPEEHEARFFAQAE